MNVYLLTNLVSGAKALVFAQVEHEARYRRPDGAVWRVGRWYEPGGRRVASPLEWWPGTPHDIVADPVMRGIDSEADALQRPTVVATQSTRQPQRTGWTPEPSRPARPPERTPRPPERSSHRTSYVAARRPRRRHVIEAVPDTV